jgi:hypothetical protein
LRAARFTSRPGHADQLHLDLWWRGLNIAQDPGTYRYTAPPPWDNALTPAAVHNTLTVDGLDQMTRAGRFLYLDWAQAEITAHERAPDGAWQRLTARHNGYRRLGLTHQRTLTAYAGGHWHILDQLLPLTLHPGPLPGEEGELPSPPDAASAGRGVGGEGTHRVRRTHSVRRTHCVRLHWLLPDWPWTLEDTPSQATLRLLSPYGWLTLAISLTPPLLPSPSTIHSSLVRAGNLLHGPGPAAPTWGWTSSTYGDRIPALAFIVELSAMPPMNILTTFTFPP